MLVILFIISLPFVLFFAWGFIAFIVENLIEWFCKVFHVEMAEGCNIFDYLDGSYKKKEIKK